MSEPERLTAIEEKVERLMAIEEIKKVKARYLRTLDQKDWDAFEAVFTPDVVFDLREAIFARDKNTGEILKSGDVQIHQEDIKDDEWRLVGAHNVRQWEQTYLTPIVTVHQAHMPEIELTSTTTAHGLWHMEHILRFPKEAAAEVWWLPDTDRLWHELHGFGLYDETYERIDGRWLIKTLKLTHFRADIT
jgi:SnoaL-like domain